jgi:alpha-L-rhamnosidase
VVAGIEIGKPGYKQMLLQPQPDRRLSHAKASYISPYGEIVSEWKIEGNHIKIGFEIPANTTAVVTLPSTTVKNVSCNGKPLVQNTFFRNVRQEGGNVVLGVGSGSYGFSYPFSDKLEK